MNDQQIQAAHAAADFLDSDDEVWQLAADAIAESRDRAVRRAGDRDSGDVLNDLITALREA